MKKLTKIAALMASLVFTMMFFNTASADVNPFSETAQTQTIVGDDGKCGDKEDKKCGDKKDKKCGDKDKKCGDKKDGKCGESKCGGK